MKGNKRMVSLAVTLVAAGMLLLLTVVAAQGQEPKPPPATPLPAGPPGQPTPPFPPAPPGPDTGQPVPFWLERSIGSGVEAQFQHRFGGEMLPGRQEVPEQSREFPNWLGTALSPTSPLAWGGPDPFGYTYADSDEPWGPDPTFEDISAVGTAVTFTDFYYTATLPFAFPFYGNTYTQTFLYGDCDGCYNDWTHLAFGVPDPWTYGSVYWMDRIDRDSGTIYVYSDTISSPARFIVQYDEVWNYGYGITTTSQVILYENGDIVVRYDSDFSWWWWWNAPWLNSQMYGWFPYSGVPQNNFAVQFYYPKGVWLWPPTRHDAGPVGGEVTYTFDLHNDTGASDTFTLTVSGNLWPTNVSPTQTGAIPAGGVVPIVVTVDVPPGAAIGDTDAAVIQVTSVTSPTVYTDTSTISTTAVCTPALVFSGQSAQTLSDLDDIYDYGGQKFTYVYVYGHSEDNDTLDATVSGYDPGSGTWQTIAQQWNGGSGIIADQSLIPPTYTRVRVQLDDWEDNDLIYYDYQFIVCREPAVDLDPLSQQSFARLGTTAVYTQMVTNYMMATDSFDLSASGNSWPTTFWDGPTQITNTGPLADLETFTFTVKVAVPAGASMGDSDAATIRARSVASPAISDTASLRTIVLAYPWVQAFSDYWAPDSSTDREQYLDIVRSFGVVPAQVTDDGDWQSSPPAVAAYPRDAIVAAWTGPYRWNGTAGYRNIEYAAFDADGNTVISVTQVSDNISATIYTRGEQPVPAVAPTNGNVLIAWHRYEDDYMGNWRYNIYYAVRGPAGSEVLSPTALTANVNPSVRDGSPGAAAFPDGRFVIAWDHWSDATGAFDIYYAVLDSTGGLLVGPINLTNNPAGHNDNQPRANRLNDGNVLLTWDGWHGFGNEIYYAVLDSAGNVVYPVTRLTDMPHNAYNPDAVGLRNGNTVIAWEQYGYYPNWGCQIAYAVLDSAYTTIVATQMLTNTLEDWNYDVSLTRDRDDNGVLTWRGDDWQRIYYAVVDNTGEVRTWPMVFRTARGDQLDISWWGAGIGGLPVPLLTLDKTAAPDPVTAGSTLVYTLTYGNAGSSPASGVVLTETYDANVTFVAADPPPDAGNNVWNIGDLPNGMTGTIVITVEVASPLPNGTLLHNQAILDAPDTEAAVASADTVVTSAPIWTLLKSDAPDPVEAGELLVYTIAYGNSGNEDATGVVITETYDANVTFVAADPAPTGGDNVWTIGPVGVGVSDTIVLTVEVTSPLPNGTLLTNRVTLDSDQSSPVEHTITTTVTSTPVWLLTKRDSADPVAEGSTLAYTITYGNVGNENATGVSLVETYPSQVTFVTADPPPSLGNTVWNIGTLSASITATIVITVEVDTPLPNGTVLTNTVIIAGNEIAPLSVEETTLITSGWEVYLPLVVRNYY